VESQPENRGTPKFELIAGNVALDFINTLDDRPSAQPKELLTNYYDLATFGHDTGILTPPQLDYFLEVVPLKPQPEDAQQAMRRAINLREALYAIFSAVMNQQTAPQEAMDTLNANLHDAALHSRLIQLETIQAETTQPGIAQPDKAFEWRFDDMTSSYEAMLWPISRTAGDLLASADVALVRSCSSPTCQWFFLDTSKNHHRRWCNMKVCGNRAKVRKFYAKRRTA
jgi:predicted RNA-binding Zn ribbon-like protein